MISSLNLSKKVFLLSNGQWLGLLGLIFSSFALARLLRLILIRLISKIFKSKGLTLSHHLKRKFIFPLRIITFALFMGIGLPFLQIESHLHPWFWRACQCLLIVGLTITLYSLIDIFSLYFLRKAQASESKFDDIIVPLIQKSTKTFVIIVGGIALGETLELNLKGLLAGMGIIGLGLSLAAKDSLSNLFGSFTITLDRPFQIGDWVVIDDKTEGIVEEVGLRSCRIRTFYDSLITLPNSFLSNSTVNNYGQRRYRRLSTTLSIQYDTPPDKIEIFCESIRQLILRHPHTRKDYFQVYLSQMNSSSLDILLYVFFKAPDWSQELKNKHELLMDILRIAQDQGVAFAFPTRTLHLINEKEEKSPHL